LKLTIAASKAQNNSQVKGCIVADLDRFAAEIQLLKL